MAVVFKLPDLGENIESAQVVSIVAAVGDYVAAEQTLIEVETDKAVTDVPSPIAGRLLEIAVSVGDKLSVGDIIARIDESAGGDQAAAEPGATPPLRQRRRLNRPRRILRQEVPPGAMAASPVPRARATPTPTPTQHNRPVRPESAAGANRSLWRRRPATGRCPRRRRSGNSPARLAWTSAR